MAEEIWTQTGGQIDGFVQSVGTAASLRGIAEGLRRNNERINSRRRGAGGIRSAVGRQAGLAQDRRHRSGFRGAALEERLVDQIEPVSTSEAVAMAIRLAREEGLFAGTSTGANVIAALRLAQATGTRRDHRHHHVRYRDEVSENVRR